MLLELLQHHEDLFLAAIEPLIWRHDRDTWSVLRAISVTCKALHDVIVEIPLWVHCRNWHMILRSTDIKRVVYDCNRTIDTTILSINNKIVEYCGKSAYLPNAHTEFDNNVLYVYTTHKHVAGCKDIKIRGKLPGVIVRTTTIPKWIYIHPILSSRFIYDSYTDEKLIDSIGA